MSALYISPRSAHAAGQAQVSARKASSYRVVFTRKSNPDRSVDMGYRVVFKR